MSCVRGPILRCDQDLFTLSRAVLHPYPVSEDLFLVGQKGPGEQRFSFWLIDSAGGRELIWLSPESMDLVIPLPVKPRECHQVILLRFRGVVVNGIRAHGLNPHDRHAGRPVHVEQGEHVAGHPNKRLPSLHEASSAMSVQESCPYSAEAATLEGGDHRYTNPMTSDPSPVLALPVLQKLLYGLGYLPDTISTKRPTNMRRLILALLTACSLIGQDAPPAILPFGELPSRMIKPLGWTRAFLERQRSGLTGHPAEMGFPFNRGMWADELKVKEREYPKYGADWWPYEQTAYYLDGALRCAYLLDDQAFLGIQRSVITDVLDHPKPDGRLGTRNVQNDGWPMVGFMRMLLEEYENTHDPRLLSAIQRHYQLLYPDVDHMELKLSGFGERVVLHVENLCRLALLTGDHSYSATAARLYERYCEANPKSPLVHRNYRSKTMNPSGHAVSFHEFLKLPAVLHCVEPKAGDLDDTAYVFRLLADQHELADGLASAAEGLYGKRSDKVHETCNATDFIWSCGYMLEATGDGHYGDKMEKVLFNAGFGSFVPDFKAHQYYSSPNQIILTDGGNHWNTQWPFASGRLCYRPGHDTECCSGNIHRLLPVFLKRQWLCDPGTATITAALYAPSETTLPLPSGPVVIRQETSYPFEHAIDLVVTLASPQSFTLRLRIPAWSDSHQIQVNGQPVEAPVQSGFANLTRTFATGDRIRLELTTSPRMQIIDRTASISYGPLVYCLPIPAQTTVKTDMVKSSSAFPAYEFRPDGTWNYGVSRHLTAHDVTVIHAGDPTKYPWDAEGRPLRLRIPAWVVSNWTLGEKPVVPDVPRVPVVAGPQTTIELVPIGALPESQWE